MLARIRKSQENDGEGGFTLIELLVVMIIIGILAAIAIPAFLNQKKKAAETAAKSDASNISKEVAAALVDGPLVAKPTIVRVGTTNQWTLTTKTAADGTGVSTSTVNVSAGNTPAIGTYTTAPTAAAPSSNYCVQVTPVSVGTGGIWNANQNGLTKGVCAAS